MIISHSICFIQSDRFMFIYTCVLAYIHAFREFYVFVVDGPRPEKDDILELRNLMLQSVKLLVKTEAKIEDEELQSIISYLITVNEV